MQLSMLLTLVTAESREMSLNISDAWCLSLTPDSDFVNLGWGLGIRVF